MLLSSSEREFISQGILCDLRADGRSRLDYRPIQLSLNPIAQAIGSARLRLGTNGDYLVAIRGEIGRPNPEAPTEGTIACSVDCSSSASEVNVPTVTNALQNILNCFFDRKQLCISAGKHCWSLFVDVLVLESDGNDLDAAVLATRTALAATRLPGVSLEEDTEAESLVLSDDPKDTQTLNCQGLPVAVTLCQVNDASPSYFVDPSKAEQECAQSIVTIAVEPANGQISFVQKYSDGALDPSILLDMFGVAQSTASILASNGV